MLAKHQCPFPVELSGDEPGEWAWPAFGARRDERVGRGPHGAPNRRAETRMDAETLAKAGASRWSV